MSMRMKMRTRICLRMIERLREHYRIHIFIVGTESTRVRPLTEYIGSELLKSNITGHHELGRMVLESETKGHCKSNGYAGVKQSISGYEDRTACLPIV